MSRWVIGRVREELVPVRVLLSFSMVQSFSYISNSYWGLLE